MKESFIKAALDVGSSKIRVVLGELSENGEKIKVITSVETYAKGMRKATVEDMESLSQCVTQALESAERERAATR